MTIDEYEQLTPEEKEHFSKCSSCGEIFDRRNLDEVLFQHTDHKASAGHSVFRIDNAVSCAFVPPDARPSLQAQAPRGKETRPFQAPWSQNCIDTI
jgi:hypothetical protein